MPYLNSTWLIYSWGYDLFSTFLEGSGFAIFEFSAMNSWWLYQNNERMWMTEIFWINKTGMHLHIYNYLYSTQLYAINEIYFWDKYCEVSTCHLGGRTYNLSWLAIIENTNLWQLYTFWNLGKNVGRMVSKLWKIWTSL